MSPPQNGDQLNGCYMEYKYRYRLHMTLLENEGYTAHCYLNMIHPIWTVTEKLNLHLHPCDSHAGLSLCSDRNETQCFTKLTEVVKKYKSDLLVLHWLNDKVLLGDCGEIVLLSRKKREINNNHSEMFYWLSYWSLVIAK